MYEISAKQLQDSELLAQSETLFEMQLIKKASHAHIGLHQTLV